MTQPCYENRIPDAEFVYWLKKFDPDLRVVWNPVRGRWVIMERNRLTSGENCILVWETEDKGYRDLDRGIAIRLQAMSAKYSQMIVDPQRYITELENKAAFQHNDIVRQVSNDIQGMIVDDIGSWRKAYENSRRGHF